MEGLRTSDSPSGLQLDESSNTDLEEGKGSSAIACHICLFVALVLGECKILMVVCCVLISDLLFLV